MQSWIFSSHSSSLQGVYLGLKVIDGLKDQKNNKYLDVFVLFSKVNFNLKLNLNGLLNS